MIFIGRINYKYYMEDLFMSKYYSINKFSKILGVSAQTLRNWGDGVFNNYEESESELGALGYKHGDLSEGEDNTIM